MKPLKWILSLLLIFAFVVITVPAKSNSILPIDNGISIEYVLPGITVTSTSIIDVGVEKPYLNYNIILKTDGDLTNLFKWDHRIGPGLNQKIDNSDLYQTYRGFHLGSINKLL